MAKLTTTLHSYYNSSTYTTTYKKFGTGSTSSEASENAKESVSSALDGIYASIGTASTAQESTQQKIFGIECGSVSKEAATVQIHGISADTGLWGATATLTGSRTSKAWQLSAEFAITGLTASTIKTATLNITAQSNSTSSLTFRICAPKSSTKPGKYWRTTDSNAPINFNIYKEFTSKTNTNPNDYSIDILDIFKECINKGAGWISILYYGDTPYGTRELTVSGLTLDYTLTTSKCTAPTSISTNVSILKPGGKATISWSGAKAGTNNAITGYTVYWKKGALPTAGSGGYDGSAAVTSTSTSGSYTFTVPALSDSVKRGDIYYFRIVTKGTASGYNSAISSLSTNVTINSLPAAPTFTSPTGTSTAIPEPLSTSTATNITFSGISAGSAGSNDNLTRTVYYSLGSGNKTKLTSDSLSLRLTQTTVVHFYTYDSLEYSAAKDFTVTVNNRAPTISSLTTSAASTYTPVTTVSNRTAAYKINATADVTHGNRSITYKWQAVYATTAGGNNFTNTVTLSSGTLTSDKTQISLSNFDITTKINSLDRSYKIKLEITDSGVSQDGTVSNTNGTIYYLTAYPTVDWYNLFANSSILGLETKFGSKIRIKLSDSKGSLVTDLYYATSSSGTKISYSSLTANQTSDITINNDTKFPRGQTRYFYVKFSLSNAYNYSPVKAYTRASDLAPSSVTLVPDGKTASGKIYPYTDSKITILFPKIDLDDEISGTTFKIKGTTEKSITDPVVKEGTATTTSSIYTIDLTKITTKFWADLFGLGTTAPYTNDKKITVLVTITNKFGETFPTRSSEYTLYFKSGFLKAPTIKVQLWSKKSGTATYYDITGYNSSNRYPLKLGQYINFLISGIECYTNQKITITVEDSSGLISFNSKTITPTTTNMEATPAKYTTANVTFGATIPQIQSSVVDLTYTVTVTSNGVGLKSNNSNTTDGTIQKFVKIKYSYTYPLIVDFNFTSVTKDKNSDIFTLAYKITKYGTDASNSGGGSIKLRAFYATSPTDGPTELTSSSFITINNTGDLTGLIVILPSTSVNADIIYFGAYYYIQNTLARANTEDANTVPGYGTTANGKWNYTKIPQKSFSSSSDTDTESFIYKKALIKYYNETPNLLYGKNFFVMNGTTPRSESNMLLEIKDTKTRNTIYIGSGDTAGTLQINSTDGLIIDCGNW